VVAAEVGPTCFGIGMRELRPPRNPLEPIATTVGCATTLVLAVLVLSLFVHQALWGNGPVCATVSANDASIFSMGSAKSDRDTPMQVPLSPAWFGATIGVRIAPPCLNQNLRQIGPGRTVAPRGPDAGGSGAGGRVRTGLSGPRSRGYGRGAARRRGARGCGLAPSGPPRRGCSQCLL